MPTRLPDRPRAKSIRANDRNSHARNASDDNTIGKGENARRHIGEASRRQAADQSDTLDNVDWLVLCALSLAVSAMFIAALVYFGEGDATGAAAVLAGTAGIISIALFITEAPGASD